MTTQTPLIRAQIQADVTALEAAKLESQQLCIAAQAVRQVTTPTEQQQAVSTAAAIRAFIKRVRAGGKAVRDEIRQRLIDRVTALEEELCRGPESEQERLNRLVTEFQQRERARAEEEARQREMLQREAEEAARRAAEAAARVRTERDLDTAIAAEQRARELTAQAASATVLEPPKPKGAAVRRVLRYEVTDIHALYRARPDLVELRPRAQAILATCSPEMPVPGLRLWWEEQVVIRARA